MAVRAVLDDRHYWVDAAPFRAQLRYLMASASLSAEEVAAAAGISARLAYRLLHGRNGRPYAGSARRRAAGSSSCRSSSSGRAARTLRPHDRADLSRSALRGPEHRHVSLVRHDSGRRLDQISLAPPDGRCRPESLLTPERLRS